MHDRDLPTVAVDLGRVAVAARAVDHALGGCYTFPPDRAFVDVAEACCPGFIADIRANREFGQRAVRWLAGQGIEQFLDIGCGLPVHSATHETLARIGSPGRVVYVDQDLVAVAVAQNLQPAPANVTALRGDLRDPASLLTHPALLDRLDLSSPVAVLLLGVLGYLADRDGPRRIMGQLVAPLAPGSYLAVSHPVHQPSLLREQQRLRRLYAATATPLHHRSVADVRGLLAERELVAPGLVPLHDWRPDSPPTRRNLATSLVGGVAAVTPTTIGRAGSRKARPTAVVHPEPCRDVADSRRRRAQTRPSDYRSGAPR